MPVQKKTNKTSETKEKKEINWMQVCVVGFVIVIVAMCIFSFSNFQNFFGGDKNYQQSKVPAQIGYPVIVDFIMNAHNGTLFRGTMPFVAGNTVNSTQYLSDANGTTYAIHADEYNAISLGVLGHSPGDIFTVKGPGLLNHVSFVKKADVEARGLNYSNLSVGTVLDMGEEYTTDDGNKSVAKINAVIIDKSADNLTVQYAPDNIIVFFNGYYQPAR